MRHSLTCLVGFTILGGACEGPAEVARRSLPDAQTTGNPGAGGRPGTGGTGRGGATGSGGAVGQGGSPGAGGSPIPDAAAPDLRPPTGMGGTPVMMTPDMGSPSRPPDMAIPRDTNSPALAAKKALFVVEDPAVIAPGDAKVKLRLEARGLTVKIGDDDGTVADATGMDVVVISSSVRSGKVAARFVAVKAAVLCMESFIFDDMKMTGPIQDTDFGDITQTMITITRDAHALAAGLKGTVTVATQAGILMWGIPGTAAEKIATVPNEASHALVFGYPADAMMVGMRAPARRVGFFASEAAADKLSGDGQKLLDAAIDWTMGK